MGPPGSCRPQMSLMLAPWTLPSGQVTQFRVATSMFVPGLIATSLCVGPCLRHVWWHFYAYQWHVLCLLVICEHTQIARLMGPTWGPSGTDRTQLGPMLAPSTLLSGYVSVCLCTCAFRKTKMYHCIKWHHGVEIIKSKVTNMLVPIYMYCRQLYDIVLWRWRKPFRRWWSPILIKLKGRIILSSHALLRNHW